MARHQTQVIDRGANFDYMEPRRKELLSTFFSWFSWTESALPSQEAPLHSHHQAHPKVDKATDSQRPKWSEAELEAKTPDS